MQAACLKAVLLNFLIILSAYSSVEPATAKIVSEAPSFWELGPSMDRSEWVSFKRAKKLTPYLDKLLEDPATEDIRLVKVNTNIIKDQASNILVTLPDGQSIQFQKRPSSDERPDVAFWFGDAPSNRKELFSSPAEVDVDPVTWAAIFAHGDVLLGEIQVKAKLYRLDYIGEGQHVLIKVDRAKSAASCDPVREQEESTKVASMTPSTRSVIRVMYVSTVDAARSSAYPNMPADYPDLQSRIRDHLIYTNNQLVFNGLDMGYEYAGYYASNYYESGKTPEVMLRDVRFTTAALGAAVDEVRTNNRADLVMMAVVKSDIHGKAYIGSRKETGFSLWQINGSYLNMGHQLGHNLGLGHAWEEGDPLLEPPHYKFGYVYKNSLGQRVGSTIMGMFEPCEDCAFTNYYSDPNKEWQGYPLGTKDHNDAVRYIDLRRGEVEKFYP